MITRIDNTNNRPSFQSTVLLNETLYKGFNKSKIIANAWNDAGTTKSQKLTAVKFVEAVKCILNDGADNVYELRAGNPAYELNNKCHLFKNGVEIVPFTKIAGKNLSENVMNIIIEEAKSIDKALKASNEKALDIDPEKLSKDINAILGNKHIGDELSRLDVNV